MNSFIFLTIAIIGEVIATTALKLSDGFTKVIPSILVAVGYGVAFYFLSLSLKTISIGVAYAIWSGVGIVLTIAVGVFLWRESLDIARIIGSTLIISGILILNLFSKNLTH
jgi:multidrug transporter EmrE-like cation transporter